MHNIADDDDAGRLLENVRAGIILLLLVSVCHRPQWLIHNKQGTNERKQGRKETR